jgi:ParD-like antitoxin of type II ParDE toxin-antitoxin system
MGQPVKLSDSLILDARLSGEVTERSIAAQIEFWAGLGRAIETLLRMDGVLALKRLGAAKPLSECLQQIGTPKGRKRLTGVLRQRPFPHYEAASGHPGHVVRIDKHGTRTIGRFRNRRFVPV